MAGRRVVLLAIVAAVLVVCGAGVGVYVAVRYGGGGNNEQAEGATSTSTATATATLPAATPTNTVPAATPTQPVVPSPTPDTRVAIRDLPSADQIQLGPDGKYFLPDRGDGCRWDEYSRMSDPETGTSVFLGTDCPADFRISFRPGSGEVFMVVS